MKKILFIILTSAVVAIGGYFIGTNSKEIFEKVKEIYSGIEIFERLQENDDKVQVADESEVKAPIEKIASSLFSSSSNSRIKSKGIVINGYVEYGMKYGVRVDVILKVDKNFTEITYPLMSAFMGTNMEMKYENKDFRVRGDIIYITYLDENGSNVVLEINLKEKRINLSIKRGGLKMVNLMKITINNYQVL
ncbi:MAG: hypothetical protein LBO71_09460 [Prevotellaceae bacterium]|jgi:hypothetical protein|nr:hypothetical protein [Prevotellaceae bacterium]